jgi:16S rRNA (cytosine1402-N4)-methyltransferase
LTGNEASVQHVPVLLEDVLNGLRIRQGGVYLDGTVGAGGHTFEILARHPSVKVVGMDRDPAALEIAAGKLARFGERAVLVHGDFRCLDEALDSRGVGSVDGILLDLGVSSMHLDLPERGFSFTREGPLDMRMDQTDGLTASVIVNTWEEGDLARMFFRFGEEKRARDIARAIVRERKKGIIRTTGHLARVVASVPGMGRVRKIHPATRTFQALRIEVNRELDALEEAIPKGIERLAPGGRMAVISFHSLEDRIVKRGFRREENPCRCPRELHECRCGMLSRGKVITRRPVVPSEREMEENPRSRSAKLRIFEKKEERGKKKRERERVKQRMF